MIDYANCKDSFDKNIDRCRSLIDSLLVHDRSLGEVKAIKLKLVHEGLASNNIDYTDMDIIKMNRLLNVEVKIEHTMRIVRDATRVFNKLGLSIDLLEIVKVAALLHDYGRFYQTTVMDDFLDRKFDKLNLSYIDELGITRSVSGHATAGYKLLYNDMEINDFDIDDRLLSVIGRTVCYHSDPLVPSQIDINIEKYLDDSKKLLDKLSKFSDSEMALSNIVLRLIKDVDMLDIFYQNISGDIPVVHETYKCYEVDCGIEEISYKFGVSVSELMEFNNLNSIDISSLRFIVIPLRDANLEGLRVPDDFRSDVLSGKKLSLSTLVKRSDWSFIMGMWWKLSEFLQNITFTGTIENLKDTQLLDQIYYLYPDEYKFLVSEVFEYAKDVLMERRLSNAKGRLL